MSIQTRETAARASIAEIADERSRRPIRTSEHTATQRPTGKQTYRAFYLLLEIAGIPAPQTVAEMSDLIVHLSGQRDALAATTTPDAFDAGF